MSHRGRQLRRRPGRPASRTASRDGREIELEDIARLQALRTQIVAYAVSASRRADAQSAGAESTQRAIIAVAIAGPDRTPGAGGCRGRLARSGADRHPGSRRALHPGQQRLRAGVGARPRRRSGPGGDRRAAACRSPTGRRGGARSDGRGDRELLVEEDGERRMYLLARFPLLDEERRPFATAGPATDVPSASGRSPTRASPSTPPWSAGARPGPTGPAW